LAEQAGGTVTDLAGNPMLCNKPELLNPGFMARSQTNEQLRRGRSTPAGRRRARLAMP